MLTCSRLAIGAALTVAFLSAAGATAQPRVAIVAAASNSATDAQFTDPQTRLLGTGLFSAVDIINVTTPQPTPDLATLMAYDAVLVWSNTSFQSAEALGDVLADYADTGKGVVLATYVVNSTNTARLLSGRWTSGGYSIIVPASGTVTATSSIGTVSLPAHPIMQGVNSIASNTSGRPSTTMLSAHGVRVADWADGRPLAAISSTFPRRVDLGLYPPSSAVNGAFWDQSTDGARLMANALVYAAAGSSGSFPPAASSAANPVQTYVDASVQLIVNVVPGVNPASTGVAVTADLSALGGSAAQAFAPSGQQFVHTLPISNAQATGAYSLPLMVSDSQGRSSSGSINVLVLPSIPSGFVAEVEPNDSKQEATPAVLSPGQGVYGRTIGTSTSIAGESSADYYRIRVAPLPLGLYRHEMTLTTSGTAGHTGTIRALNQADGQVVPDTDGLIQTSPSNGRYNVWYGFGREENLYYRVTGGTATTLEYTATLTTSAVFPWELTTPLGAGPITIRRGQFNVTVVQMLVYDSNFQAVGDFLNDGDNTLTRTFGPGTYYLAVSTVNTADSRPVPADSSLRTNSVMDFPNIVANSTSNLANDMTMEFVADGGATIASVFAAKSSPFEVAWIRFTVTGCAGDFNHDGGVTVQDIFDFLGAFFGNDPSADIDHSGTISVQDVFDYLAAFFAGC